MKKLMTIAMTALLLIGCSEDPEKKVEEPSIIRNLPTQDRDFLLEPLEGALDDLRDIAESDPGIEEQTFGIDTLGWKGTRKIGTRNGDTLRSLVNVRRASIHELHWRYWDESGEMYYLESWIKYLNEEGKPQNQVAYKLYLEEGGVLISSYERRAYDGKPLTDSWRSSAFTPEEMNYILHAGKR